MILPAPIQNLIDAFSRLPGVGPKTASRLTFYLLRADERLAQDLAEALQTLKSGTSYCPVCFNIMEAGREMCGICASVEREARFLCVVEDPLDVLAIERAGGYRGRYQVLHGTLSPIEGVGPDDLKIVELVQRVQADEIQEVILATNPSMEGDATAMYLHQRLRPLGVRVTNLARGLPTGGDLEYADQNTILQAFAGRQAME